MPSYVQGKTRGKKRLTYANIPQIHGFYRLVWQQAHGKIGVHLKAPGWDNNQQKKVKKGIDNKNVSKQLIVYMMR
jgi:hypothetical protein